MAWYKADVRGFLRDEKLTDLELRGAWASVLALAKFCNHNGMLIDSLDDPLTDSDICHQSRFNQSHLDKLREVGLVDFVTIGVTKVTNIKNWLKYQPEYDRQKPYRLAKKKVVTIPVTMTRVEKETIEGDRDKRLKPYIKGGSMKIPKDVRKLFNRLDELHEFLPNALSEAQEVEARAEISRINKKLESLNPDNDENLND